VSGGETHIVHDAKPVAPQLTRLGWLCPVAGCASDEAMSGAACRPILHRKVSAGDVKNGVHVEVAIRPPERAECDLLGMPEQPRCFMIKGGRPFLQFADPQ